MTNRSPNELKALSIQQKFLDLCKEHQLWAIVEHIRKPDLKMIKIKEISIKVD